jgi:hypothetical protein
MMSMILKGSRTTHTTWIPKFLNEMPSGTCNGRNSHSLSEALDGRMMSRSRNEQVRIGIGEIFALFPALRCDKAGFNLFFLGEESELELSCN